jgi:dTDP-glucose 4,6-dehydratase
MATLPLATVRDALCADQVVIRSCGTAVRSYLHGADLAAWLLALLVNGKAGEAYNVGSDQAISIADLAHRVVSRVAQAKQVLIMGRTEGTAPSFYVPDISQARGLGLDVWTPWTSRSTAWLSGRNPWVMAFEFQRGCV